MTSPESAEPIPSPEVKHNVMLTGLLSGVANHEAKMAVAEIVMTQPERWFNGGPLFQEVRIRQGSTPGWLPDNKIPFKYCVDSLGPVGLVVKGRVESVRGTTDAYKANTDDPELQKLAEEVNGSLLEWSLEHPETSVQKVFGVTAAHGKFRSPELRPRVLKAIVESPDPEPSYASIADVLADEKVDRFDIYSHIRELEDLGIVETSHIDSASDIKLEIIDPDYRHTGLKIEQLNSETQLAYQAIQILFSAGKRIIEFSDLLTQARAIDPSVDPIKMKQPWYSGSSFKSENFPGLIRVERAIEYTDKNSVIKLKPGHADAIIELVIRLQELHETSASTALGYYKKAREIINNPSLMAQVFSKAKRFSVNVKGQEEGAEIVKDRLERLVGSLGSVTVNNARDALAEQGRPLSRGSVGKYLGQLVAEGRLQAETKQADETKKRRTLHYSAVATTV